MTAKVMDLQTRLEELQKKYEHRLEQEESAKDSVRGLGVLLVVLGSVAISTAWLTRCHTFSSFNPRAFEDSSSFFSQCN